MVYAGTIDDQVVHLGVSGRLLGVEQSRSTGVDVRNLVMWDPQTDSLWGQLRGEALTGPHKGARLTMLPSVLVGLGTWKAMHPETAVLDLEPVRRKPWHFTAADLRRGAVRGTPLAIGLRHGDATAAVTLAALQARGTVDVVLEDTPLLVVWSSADGAAFVYESGGRAIEIADGALRATASDDRWNLNTGTATGASDTSDLRRFAYIPTYLPAWRTYYPDSTVIDE